jgi:hypothetical protein
MLHKTLLAQAALFGVKAVIDRYLQANGSQEDPVPLTPVKPLLAQFLYSSLEL